MFPKIKKQNSQLADNVLMVLYTDTIFLMLATWVRVWVATQTIKFSEVRKVLKIIQPCTHMFTPWYEPDHYTQFAGPCLKSMKLMGISGTRIGGGCRERAYGPRVNYRNCMLMTCAGGMDAFIMHSGDCLMLSCSGRVAAWPCDYHGDVTCGRAYVKE